MNIIRSRLSKSIKYISFLFDPYCVWKVFSDLFEEVTTPTPDIDETWSTRNGFCNVGESNNINPAISEISASKKWKDITLVKRSIAIGDKISILYVCLL